MLKIYIYLTLILSMILILALGYKNSVKRAPNKIKLVSLAAIIAMALRIIMIIIFFIIDNMRYLYFLKPFYFMDFISVPMAAMVVIYILNRNDRIKFLWVFPICGVLVAAYAYLIYKYECILHIDNLCGYYMEFFNAPYIYVGYMLTNVLFIILIIMIYRKNIDKCGVALVVLSCVILICENLMHLFGMDIFHNLILGDILWMITLNYSIIKIKKASSR